MPTRTHRCLLLVVVSLLVSLTLALGDDIDGCARWNGDCQACLSAKSTNASDTVPVCTFCIDNSICSTIGNSSCSAPWFKLTVGDTSFCPVADAFLPHPTSSSGATGTAAFVLVILGPIFIFCQLLSILFRKSNLPVVGRALRNSKLGVYEENGVNTSRPVDAFIAISLKGFMRVDLDSNRNRAIAPLTFFLTFYIVAATSIALGLNTFSSALVSLDSKIALMGIAMPDDEIKAGMLGLNGLNLLKGNNRYGSICSLLEGDDHRSCIIVQVIGISTVAFAAIIILMGIIATVWLSMMYISRRHHVSSKPMGYVPRPLTLPPRFYTLIAVSSWGLGAIMLMWGLVGKLAFDTGAMIPYGKFSTGNSWLIILLTKIHVEILQFIVWHLIESAWLPERGTRPIEISIGQSSESPQSLSLSLVQQERAVLWKDQTASDMF